MCVCLCLLYFVAESRPRNIVSPFGCGAAGVGSCLQFEMIVCQTAVPEADRAPSLRTRNRNRTPAVRGGAIYLCISYPTRRRRTGEKENCFAHKIASSVPGLMIPSLCGCCGASPPLSLSFSLSRTDRLATVRRMLISCNHICTR